MRQATGAAAANPFDVRALWDMNAAPFDAGEGAYRAWMDAATRMQTEATAFWNGRLAKDMAALSALGQCTTPVQALEAQMRYMREAMGDWYAEGQRMLRITRDAAAGAGMPGGETPHAHKAAR
ncbi:MAG: phasin family protein [Burkholderiales bacterium]